MKITFKNTLYTALMIGALSFMASCGKSSNESEGTEDAREANGDTSGTETPATGEGSGSATDADMGEAPNSATATDTVQGTTTNGNGAASNGTPAN